MDEFIDRIRSESTTSLTKKQRFSLIVCWASVLGMLLCLVAATAFGQCPGGVCRIRQMPTPNFAMPQQRQASPQRSVPQRPARGVLPVRVELQSGGRVAFATAVKIGAGMYLSAAHSFDSPFKRCIVGTSEAAVVRLDQANDLALLRGPDNEQPVWPLARRGASRITLAYYVGGSQYRQRAGAVVGVGGIWGNGSEPNSFELSVGAESGGSGGLATADGAMHGLIVGGSSQAVCLDVPTIRAFLQSAEKPQSKEPPSNANGMDKLDILLAEIKRLDAKIEAVANRPYPTTPGPAGEQGPAGPQGPPGKTPELNYDQMAAEIQRRLDPITVQTIRDGRVIEEETIYLGGTLPLRLVPVPRRVSQ